MQDAKGWAARPPASLHGGAEVDFGGGKPGGNWSPADQLFMGLFPLAGAFWVCVWSHDVCMREDFRMCETWTGWRLGATGA